MAQPDLVVWQLTDGKRGHERQAEGLIAALAERGRVDHHRIAIKAALLQPAIDALRGRFAGGAALPRPQLIIGAGRACHWPLIAARRAFGGRTICLMRPGLPLPWFDLCIIPRHDRPAMAANVIVSEGPLNPMRPAVEKSPRLGLILVGGPSAHHAWNSATVVAQIRAIVASAVDVDWQIADSRRTPADFRREFATLPEPRPQYVSFAECAPHWLQQNLARAAIAWVSADSVAMIYEALSAGTKVGIVEVPVRRHDRISAIAADLIDRGWVRTLAADTTTTPPLLDEARRCAGLLAARWPDLAGPAP